MTPFETDVFLLAERTGLLLALIRLFKDAPDEDYRKATELLEPAVSQLLTRVRDQLPRPQ
jgi:hypothetical protein